MSEIDLPALGWIPREYQRPLWQYFDNGGKRAAISWHRRAGKDLFAINRIAYCAAAPEKSHPTARIGLYWHILPTFNQGRKVIWEGITNDGKKFIDAFPQPLVSSINNQEMRIGLSNGSTYQVLGGDDPDRLVGANPVGIVFSEYSIMPEKTWHYLIPILNANDGWALFIFTPRGENHAFRLINAAKSDKKWFSQILTIKDTFYTCPKTGEKRPVVPESLIDDDRKNGMDEATVQQEYYGSFKASLKGAYYGDQMDKAAAEGRILSVPWESALPVHTAWDLGLDDMTAIWFFQQSPGNEIRLIDFYQNSGEGLLHYIKYIKDKDYYYGNHYLPWDIAVKELTTGKSRYDMVRQAGLRPAIIVKQHSVADGIETTRSLLPQCFFDEKKCKDGIEALKSYRKQWNETLCTYREQPLHDSSSHGADSMRTLAMGIRRPPSKQKKPTTSESTYDPLN
jgi:hypothetical protein